MYEYAVGYAKLSMMDMSLDVSVPYFVRYTR